MKSLLGIAIVVSLAVTFPAQAATPKSSPPTQLWQKYPLGKQKLAPLVVTQRLATRPASATTVRQPPAPLAVGSGGGFDVPLWAVLLAAMALSSTFALAGESVVARVRHGLRRSSTLPWPHERRWGRTGRSMLLDPLAARRSWKLGPLRNSVARLERAARPLMRDDPILAAVVRDARVRSRGGYWAPSGPNDLLPRLMEDEMTDDLGDRVATVLRAAEEVAEQIRDEAREEAEAMRRHAEEAAAARAEAYVRDLLESSERVAQDRAGNGRPAAQNFAEALAERALSSSRAVSELDGHSQPARD